jgi:hypothetical protein
LSLACLSSTLDEGARLRHDSTKMFVCVKGTAAEVSGHRVRREVEVMKWLSGAFTLFLLVMSRRYRAGWARASGAVSDALDDVEARQRRADAADNGGNPRLRLVS